MRAIVHHGRRLRLRVVLRHRVRRRHAGVHERPRALQEPARSSAVDDGFASAHIVGTTQRDRRPRGGRRTSRRLHLHHTAHPESDRDRPRRPRAADACAAEESPLVVMRTIGVIAISAALLAGCASHARVTPPAHVVEPPKADLERAAQYLDARAIDWVNHTPDAGQNVKCAISCHTTHTFLVVRALLPAPGSAIELVRARVGARVLENADWSKATPLYGKPGSKLEASSRATEAVMNAASLALADLSTSGEPTKLTLDALDRMWSMQNADGAFAWLDFELEPWESSSDVGAAMALLAIGAAGDAYQKGALHRASIERLVEYVRHRFTNEAKPIAIHDQALVLWASHRMPDLLDPVTRSRIADRLRTLEQHDGGWSLATWGRGKRARPDAESDAYATALATIALAEGESTTANGVRRGLDWLAAHQRKDGAFHARSVNKAAEANDRFMTDAATAYAAYALAKFR